MGINTTTPPAVFTILPGVTPLAAGGFNYTFSFGGYTYGSRVEVLDDSPIFKTSLIAAAGYNGSFHAPAQLQERRIQLSGSIPYTTQSDFRAKQDDFYTYHAEGPVSRLIIGSDRWVWGTVDGPIGRKWSNTRIWKWEATVVCGDPYWYAAGQQSQALTMEPAGTSLTTPIDIFTLPAGNAPATPWLTFTVTQTDDTTSTVSPTTVAAPTTVISSGAAGSVTTRSYYVVARSTTGYAAVPSLADTITTVATLTGTNKVTVNWVDNNTQAGVTVGSYDILCCLGTIPDVASAFLVGTVAYPTISFDDTTGVGTPYDAVTVAATVDDPPYIRIDNISPWVLASGRPQYCYFLVQQPGTYAIYFGPNCTEDPSINMVFRHKAVSEALGSAENANRQGSEILLQPGANANQMVATQQGLTFAGGDEPTLRWYSRFR